MEATRDWSGAITIPATADGIERLDRWIAGRCVDRGLPLAMSDAVRLCAAEIVTNVMEHGFGGRDGGTATVRLSHGADVRLEIADEGKAFDPTTAVDPPMPTSIETAPRNGYGLRLVRGFARSFTYRRDAGRNVVTLVFDAPTPG